jgi:hypothetical protein
MCHTPRRTIMFFGYRRAAVAMALSVAMHSMATTRIVRADSEVVGGNGTSNVVARARQLVPPFVRARQLQTTQHMCAQQRAQTVVGRRERPPAGDCSSLTTASARRKCEPVAPVRVNIREHTTLTSVSPPSSTGTAGAMIAVLQLRSRATTARESVRAQRCRGA